ncbi:MAG TPA: hypothetical protein VNL77_16550 [Roseiflexaceae bacterium]|nr:hypothetical protein [Roseiflexaceae bacterium]
MQDILTPPPEPLQPDGQRRLAPPLALALLAGLAAWLIVARLTPGAGRPPYDALDDRAQSAFIAATGVRVMRVAVTAGGGMVDLRYQVIDPAKAAVIHDLDRPPAVVDEATGQVISQPWMQHAHAGEIHAGVTYYMLLVNPKGVITPGSRVSVVIGDARLEHVVAQ